MRKMPCKDNNPKRNGQIVGRSLLADGGRCQIYNNTVAGKMQASVLDRGLHTFTTLLHGSVGESDNCDSSHAVGIIHFDLDDNSFESDNSTGKYACKHVESVDEEG